MPGSIYKVHHFPAFRPEPSGEVHGQLYLLSNPVETFAALDDYEGDEFERVVIRTAVGQDAWIYRYRKVPPDSAIIASGDFCAQ